MSLLQLVGYATPHSVQADAPFILFEGVAPDPLRRALSIHLNMGGVRTAAPCTLSEAPTDPDMDSWQLIPVAYALSVTPTFLRWTIQRLPDPVIRRPTRLGVLYASLEHL